MGVDEEFVDADVDQVVETKGDQWLLEDRHERFRQFVGQRPKSGAQSRAEDECLFDCGHGVKNSACPRKSFGAEAFHNGRTSAFSWCRSWSRSPLSLFGFCSHEQRRPRLETSAGTSCSFLSCQSLSLRNA